MEQRQVFALVFISVIFVFLLFGHLADRREANERGATDTNNFRGRLISTPTIKIMSYNTARVNTYGFKMIDVGAAVVATQEGRDSTRLATTFGYQVVPGTGPRNAILYDRTKVRFVANSGGWMDIPCDNNAVLMHTVTWAKFNAGGNDFWLFNTHLPHPDGEALSRNTDALIARMLLRRRKELGADDIPTVITGNVNPCDPSDSPEGTFESLLVHAGFEKSYQAPCSTAGHARRDQIFASQHWQASNGADKGAGINHYPGIAVDLTLKSSSSSGPAPPALPDDKMHKFV